MPEEGFLVGIDPGGSNGVAVRLPNDFYVTATYDTPQAVWDIFRQYPQIKAVALETFHGSGRMNVVRIHTIEIVGSIRGICYVKGIPCFGQTTQTCRSYIPDAIATLTKQGRRVRMTKAEDDHEVMALAHLHLLEDRIKKGTAKL